MVQFALIPFIFALGAAAQSVAYTDPNTGIDFMSYYDTDTETRWSIATPETNEKDFIAQMVAPTTTGWAGLDLGATMENKLLVVAWPNGDDIISSFREATGYTSPAVYTGNVTAIPIANGTFVNSTHFSYTFVCSGCITGDSDSFTDAVLGNAFGWAYSEDAPTTPTDATTALTYHSAGYGEFSIIFANSSSASYSTWASWAEATTTTTTSGSNSTTTTSSSNSTTTSTSGSSGNATVTATVSNTTYDYIIAGAGPAGIIVAERLAESGAEVLLIERGDASTYATGGSAIEPWNDTITQYDVPAMGYWLTTSTIDTSEYCTDTADMAGCLLGGSSMVNALMFVHPQERDFDDKWPTGWKWSDVESAAESFYERNPGTTSPSADGKRYDQGAYDVLSSFFSGNGWTSVDAIEEPNKKTDVFSHPPWNIKNGMRAGPTMTYLPLAKALSNFHLQLNSTVVRAVRDGSLISGVEIETVSGARQIINVKDGGKVILASGALSTPRILINSGIGPAEQIQTVQSGSVSVTLPDESEWIDLPVGKGLKDHPIVVLKFNTSTELSSLSGSDFTDPTLENADMFAQGSGLLVQAGQRLNFWTSVNGTDGVERFIQGTCNSPSNNTIQIKVYLTHGLTSTGEIGITASGATEYITKPWLNTQADKDALASFIDRLLEYTRADNSTLSLSTATGPSNSTGASLIETYITGSHYVGTAKMGTDDGRTNNGSSVVDLDTKVYGTDNLFVVDASFHPDLPTGNTQAIVMIAAEAAASKVLNVQVSSSNSTSTSNKASASGSSSISVAAASTAPYNNETESSSAVSAVSTGSATATITSAASSTSSVDVSAISSGLGYLTSVLPTGALTSTIATAMPSASAFPGSNLTTPTKPLPKDFTLEELIHWVEYLIDETLIDIKEEEAGLIKRSGIEGLLKKAKIM